MDDDLQPVLEEDNSPQKPLITKVYEAVFAKFDGETFLKFYRRQRLIEAAEAANQVVKGDPFTTLKSVRELGPLE